MLLQRRVKYFFFSSAFPKKINFGQMHNTINTSDEGTRLEII